MRDSESTMGLGFVGPGTLPVAVRHDRTWVHLNRAAARHKRAGKCGCGEAKENEIHKLCAKCAKANRIHGRAAKLRAERHG
jgi:hypothetical protein